CRRRSRRPATACARSLPPPLRAPVSRDAATADSGNLEVRSTVAAVSPPGEPMDRHDLDRQREIDDLKRKSLVSLVIGLGMMAFMYLPFGFGSADLAPFLLIAGTVVPFWAV